MTAHDPSEAKVPSRYVSPRTKPSSSKAPAPPRRKSGETQNILIVETPLEIHAEPAVEIPAAAESEIAECIQEAGIPSSGSTARLLSNAERIDILADLKVQWERLSDAYRRLPIASDTPSRMRRKGDLEAQLQVLEKEMERFASSNVMVA
ncbi:uncharacterized protein EV422DRAFT_507662 [Fimicolochytrium jonesii]|uniref:uncharacterized protein n=1 Tax=Fimicolochytrium jonesii TaxID=1396493 RepID=UPI0022FF15EA|nr:uncharacterized protein EV422DRAFT_507662 [Fimicolochytrium jonesii]KAI8819215.1 hypothetical protein EV422DRAFT_507662 [Fimicolochytrium jonesii]